MLRWCVEGHERAQRRRDERTSEAHQGEAEVHHTDLVRNANDDQPGDQQQETRDGQLLLAVDGCELADDAPLDDDHDEAEVEEQVGDLSPLEREAVLRQEGQGGLHAAEREVVEEVGQVGEAYAWEFYAPEKLLWTDRSPSFPCLAAVFGAQSLIESAPYSEEIDEAQDEGSRRGSGEGVDPVGLKGRKVSAEVDLTEKPADEWPQGETEADGRAHHPHSLGTIFGSGRVGHGGGCGRDVAAHEPPEESRSDQQRETAAEEPQKVTESDTSDREQQDWPTPYPIGEASPKRREEELQDRVNPHEYRSEEGLNVGPVSGSGGPGQEIQQAPQRPAASFAFQVVLEHVGEERQDDGEADDVEEDGQEDDPERGPAGGFVQGQYSSQDLSRCRGRTQQDEAFLLIDGDDDHFQDGPGLYVRSE